MAPMKIQLISASLLLTALYIGTTSITIAAEPTGQEVKSPSNIENKTMNHHHGSMHKQSNPDYDKANTGLPLKQEEKQHDHKRKDIASIAEATLHSHENTHSINPNSSRN